MASHSRALLLFTLLSVTCSLLVAARVQAQGAEAQLGNIRVVFQVTALPLSSLSNPSWHLLMR
jgi:hypothetical protein